MMFDGNINTQAHHIQAPAVRSPTTEQRWEVFDQERPTLIEKVAGMMISPTPNYWVRMKFCARILSFRSFLRLACSAAPPGPCSSGGYTFG